MEYPKPQKEELQAENEEAMRYPKPEAQAAMRDSKPQAEEQAAMEHPKPQAEEESAMESSEHQAEDQAAMGDSKLQEAAMEHPKPQVEFPKPQLRLLSIEESRRHKFMLKEWKREAKFLESDYDRKLNSSRRSEADLVTILGLNFAFQGLLVSGVAPSQNIVCRHFPTVCVLSVVASLGAFFATLRKLKEIACNQERLNLQKKQMTWRNARINELKEQGVDYVIEDIQPFTLGPSDISSDGFLQSGFQSWMLSHLGAVRVLLIVYSVAIVVSMKWLLCSREV